MDGDVIIGLASDVITFGFTVTCGGMAPTALPRATLLEEVTDRSTFGIRQPALINAKITLGGISGTNLLDQKFILIIQGDRPRLYNGFFAGGGYPAGYVFDTYTQTLKLQIPDLNGDPKIFPLGPTFTFTQTSNNGTTSPTTLTIK